MKVTIDVRGGPGNGAFPIKKDMASILSALDRAVSVHPRSGDGALIVDAIAIIEKIRDELPQSSPSRIKIVRA